MTDEFLAAADRACPDLVGGLYLHGSLCWGEFFADSDIDFVGTFNRTPTDGELHGLAAAHTHIRDHFPDRRFEGFYCRTSDLAAPPTDLSAAPAHYEGDFDPAGGIDVNLVTWHELSERGFVIRGVLPAIYTNLDRLLDYTRENLTAYWQPLLGRVGEAGAEAVGADDWLITWVTLGAARLHHLLARRTLTSKSGAGRYILEALDPRWEPLARDALAIRERPGTPSCYDDTSRRGHDLLEFLAWAVHDGLRLR